MRRGIGGEDRTRALSEVIGFILIIGILMVALSLYLIYGVPVQGRENEINHMNSINDQFVTYKLGVDSLWTNQQENIAISTTFPLGTQGQTAQGSTSIIPVLQPIGSSGALAINQRTITPEIFTVSSNSYITNLTSMTSGPALSITSQPAPQTYSWAPSMILVTLNTKFSSWTDKNPGGVQISGAGWNATINVTPNIAECLVQNGTLISYNSSCNGADITITVIKNGVTTLNRAIIDSNINPQTNYSINLLDAAYGLQPVISYPAVITYSKYDLPGNLTATVNAQNAYQQQNNYSYSVPLGSLEYSTNNNYWIPQTYYYQMGGIFLSQSDGITYKLPPEISFSNNGNGNVTISVVAIAFDPSNSGVIGGNSPAQVSTILKPDAGTLPYAPITLNTWNANLNITTPDPNAAIMWAAYLNAAANQTAGIPTSLYSAGNTTSGSYISFPGMADGNPHITLSVKTANLTANIQSVTST